MSYAVKKQFYSPPFLSPKSEKSLQELAILPNLEGVYKFDPKPPAADAVFLSHGHLDHPACLSFIKGEIPVYCGDTTMMILQTLSQVRRAELGFNVADINLKSFRTGDKIHVSASPLDPSTLATQFPEPTVSSSTLRTAASSTRATSGTTAPNPR
jgi:mRNA degradation ribonuclease J1/J2